MIDDKKMDGIKFFLSFFKSIFDKGPIRSKEYACNLMMSHR